MTVVFSPGVSGIISGSATSVALSINGDLDNIRIFNDGPNVAFVRWGIGTQTAVLTDMILAIGALENFDKGQANSIAIITSAAGSAIVYVTPGEGQ